MKTIDKRSYSDIRRFGIGAGNKSKYLKYVEIVEGKTKTFTIRIISNPAQRPFFSPIHVKSSTWNWNTVPENE